MADQVTRRVAVLAAAELLCKTYTRHKPVLQDRGFFACDRCVRELTAWDDWLARGEVLAMTRGVLG